MFSVFSVVPKNTIRGARQYILNILTPISLVLFSVCCLVTSVVAQSSPTAFSTWEVTSGQKVTGELRFIKNRQVEIRFPDGRRTKIKLEHFTEASRNAIQIWVREQGGTPEFTSWIKSPDTAFSKKWPSTVHGPSSPEIHIIPKETRRRHYTFESPHYRFVSDAKLSSRVVQQFATLFETTYAYNMALPLNVPGRYRPKEHRYLIYLFSDYEKYIKSGGLPDSAGTYQHEKKYVLIPLVSLGVLKKGSRWIYHKGGENTVIAHELTHQLMDGELRAAWYVEGSAEYIASTRYTHAAFHIYGGLNHMFLTVTSRKASKAHVSRRLGPRLTMPTLKAFMNMPYAQFAAKPDANQNYGMALLLTYYFYHIDGSKNAHHIKNYIKALQRGKSEADAQKQLLNGRSYLTVQKSFQQFCAKNGLIVDFE